MQAKVIRPFTFGQTTYNVGDSIQASDIEDVVSDPHYRSYVTPHEDEQTPQSSLLQAP